MEDIINTKRAKLFQSQSIGRNARYATFNLPPIAIEVIAESREPEQLIPVAVQLRDKYQELRAWIGEYQKALDSENPKIIKKYVGLLQSIANEIDSKYSSRNDDALKLFLGTSWLNISTPVPTIINKVRNRFGVRAMLSGFVFYNQGEKSLKKLLALFGERNNQFADLTLRQLISRYSQPV